MQPIDRSLIVQSEHAIEDELRRQLLAEINRRGLGPEELAERLGMLRPSAELLIERKTWPLELGLRVAKGLGMNVEVRTTLGS